MDTHENTKRGRGRPQGARNAERVYAVSLPAACPTCGSTRREPYQTGPVYEHFCDGVIDGRKYNRLVWRRTRCEDCGQNLTIREYLYEPPVVFLDAAVDEKI